MKQEEFLKKQPSDRLTVLFPGATNELLTSRIKNQDPADNERYQKLMELIQKVMVVNPVNSDSTR